MQTVAEIINGMFNELSPSEKRIARIVLSNYPLSGLSTIAGLSEQSNVSDPTVLRFVNKLGFKKYPDFQNKLKQEIDQSMKGPLSIGENPKGDLHDITGYFERFTDRLHQNICDAFTSISQAEIEEVLDTLSDKTKNIYLIGGQFTDSVARYLYFHLRKMRPNVSLLYGQSISWGDHLLDLSRKDVIIVFDVRRYQPDILEFANRASKKVHKIILITDEWLSPISKVSDHVLSCKVSSLSRWDSLVAMTALIEALMERFAEKNWSSIEKRLSELEEVRNELFSNHH